MKLHPIACILLCCASAFASATDLPITKGMPFLSARKALIAHGWKPIATVTDETTRIGTETILSNLGFIEVERCTQGFPYCEFNYKKNNKCLVISTIGEEIKDLVIRDWGFTCPVKY